MNVPAHTLTSNRAPAEWAEVFHDPLLASAGLDRLLHHADVLVITGDSYRARNRQILHTEPATETQEDAMPT